MSTESCIGFYGVRFELHENEIESLEDKSDSRLVLARKHGLKNYWGNFSSSEEKWFLFIGARLSVLGAENERDYKIDSEALLELMRGTENRLTNAGIKEKPALYLQWQPDI